MEKITDWNEIWRRYGNEVYIPITGINLMDFREWLEKNYEVPQPKRNPTT